ncbi:hypothetical protein CL634_07810 [bacterium]|nr:hypothetical protein [bacterium]|tara:strand:+ start:516 stop:746 length:231 start_codon:yes stop_codon:yes gene_type:complete
MITASIKEIIDIFGDKLDNPADWITLKKLLLLSLQPKERKKFSKRDSKTKLQSPPNDFEMKIISYYENTIGKKIRI